MSYTQAFKLRLGDSIDWAGHKSTITKIRLVSSGTRGGRLFDFDIDDWHISATTGVHYFDSEQVWLWVDGPRPLSKSVGLGAGP